MPDDLQPLRFLPTALRIEAEAGFFDEVLTGWKRNQYAQNFGRSTGKTKTPEWLSVFGRARGVGFAGRRLD